MLRLLTSKQPVCGRGGCSIGFSGLYRASARAPALPFLRCMTCPKEDTMKRSLALVVAGLVILGAHRASAQEAAPGPGALEVTIIPGGATFFTSKNAAPTFGDYTLGGTVTY